MTEREAAYEEKVAHSLRAEIDGLLATGKATVAAERDYWLARLRFTRSTAKNVALLAGAALAVGMGAVLAFILGLLLILAPLVGPGWATAIVTAVFASLAMLLGWLAMRQARLLSFSPKEAD